MEKNTDPCKIADHFTQIQEASKLHCLSHQNQKGPWEYLKYNKKQKKLGLANIQKDLRVVFITSQTTDFIHKLQASTSMNCKEFNKHISQSVDALIALLVDLTRNILSLRQSTMNHS